MTTKRFLLPILALSAIVSCKSHKTADSLNYHQTDTCTSQTHLNLNSILSLSATDTLSASKNQDHIEFYENEGEIQLLPDGIMYIKGVKSAVIARSDLQKTSNLDLVVKDTLTKETSAYSKLDVSAISKPTKTPSSHSNPWIMIAFALAIFIILLLIGRLRKR